MTMIGCGSHLHRWKKCNFVPAILLQTYAHIPIDCLRTPLSYIAESTLGQNSVCCKFVNFHRTEKLDDISMVTANIVVTLCTIHLVRVDHKQQFRNISVCSFVV